MGRRRALRAAGVVGLAVALTGCMKIDVDYTINSDETVDGTVIMALNRDLAEMSGDSESMIDDLLGNEGVPEGATAERYEDDEFVGAEYTFDAVPLDELNLDGSDSESLSITHEGDEFVASGVMDLSDTGMEDLGDDAGQLGQGVLDSMDIRIAITFPGEVLETNGEVDGTTVVWEPVAGERTEISARAADSGGVGGLPVWAWILIGIVVVAAVGALIFVLTRSRNQTPDDAATADVADTPPTYPPPAASGVADGGATGAPAAGAPATGAAAAAAPSEDVPPGDPASDAEFGAAEADAVGPVDDVPPVPPAYEEPTTFGVDQPLDDGGDDEDQAIEREPVTEGNDVPTAPPAPQPPGGDAGDAGEAPGDITGVSDTTSDTSTDVADDGDGDTLQPPR